MLISPLKDLFYDTWSIWFNGIIHLYYWSQFRIPTSLPLYYDFYFITGHKSLIILYTSKISVSKILPLPPLNAWLNDWLPYLRWEWFILVQFLRITDCLVVTLLQYMLQQSSGGTTPHFILPACTLPLKQAKEISLETRHFIDHFFLFIKHYYLILDF